MVEDVRREMVALLPRLRRYAYSLSGSMDHADELVQAACERALSRLDQYETGTRLDSWMFRLVQTIWIDRKRYDARRQNVSDEEVIAALAFDARIHERTEARFSLDIVRREIAKLSDDQRSVLSLVAIEGMSYQEAADTLGVKIGTIMSRLSRARLRLTAAVDAGFHGDRTIEANDE
ncbi:MAG: RNA polymerase sigma factor [Rhodomicrobium sp.]|nr:RNA polymerase sigma factor [Rhodomicrobium sp.]